VHQTTREALSTFRVPTKILRLGPLFTRDESALLYKRPAAIESEAGYDALNIGSPVCRDRCTPGKRKSYGVPKLVPVDCETGAFLVQRCGLEIPQDLASEHFGGSANTCAACVLSQLDSVLSSRLG
jgi:hypothetical protein